MNANPSVYSHPNLWMLTQKDKKNSIISHAYHQIKKKLKTSFFSCAMAVPLKAKFILPPFYQC